MERILEDRESRYYKILDLIDEYRLPVICGKLNYPGLDKNTPEALRGFEILREEMEKHFRNYMIEGLETGGYDGKAYLMSLNLEPQAAKGIAMAVEESHRIGRIFDIDVYIQGGTSLSRSEVGKRERECIVCGGSARECIRGGRHKLHEVVDCVNNLINECGQ